MLKLKPVIKSKINQDSKLWRLLSFLYHRIPHLINRSPYVLRSRINRYRSRAILETFAERTRNVFFIHIGANDGVSADELHSFICSRQWSGILVEPDKGAFDKLKINYRDLPNLSFENSAISDSDCIKSFYTLPGHSTLSSLLPNVVEKSAEWLGISAAEIVAREVPCISLSTLLQRYRVSKVDLFSVDTEGHDYEIIKLVDFAMFRPKIIMYEEMHLQAADQKACRDLLKRKGYRIIRYWGDVLAVNTRVHSGPASSQGTLCNADETTGKQDVSSKIAVPGGAGTAFQVGKN